MLDLDYKLNCINKLKAGYKVLIMGNHDKGASNYKKTVKTERIYVSEGEFTQGQAEFERKLFESGYRKSSVRTYSNETDIFEYQLNNRLFDEVYEGNLFISDKILLSHAPAPEAGYINLHGHDHAHNDGYCFAAEHIGYTPVCLKTIFESGALGKTTSFRRSTVDRAIERKKKREGK